MKHALVTLAIQFEEDVVLCRQRVREIATILGFDKQGQTRLSTAVSEIARNAFRYAKGGKAQFYLETEPIPRLVIVVSDKGKGISNISEILEGNYRSSTGMGLGILGSKRLMDEFHIETEAGSGTIITLKKNLNLASNQIDSAFLAKLSQTLLQTKPLTAFDEVRQQNQELLNALTVVQTQSALLEKQKSDLQLLNDELEETNRGVVALYAELDEKAQSLQKANALKTRFLSNMNHELRTPLNSILSLSKMLIKKTDGDLNPEQEKQVNYIRRSTETLTELVNDLLDLAKIEAGKTPLRLEEFEIQETLLAIRGMFRPLLENSPQVELVFESSLEIPGLYSDQGKIAQIIRNLISNALKFTEKGSVRVKTSKLDEKYLLIQVIDTGIGIAKENISRIFEEFTQVDSSIQRKVKGTGLGLPLSKSLAELLGGRIFLESEPDKGSCFSIVIPFVFSSDDEHTPISKKQEETKTIESAIQLVQKESIQEKVITAKERLNSPKILVIEDNEIGRYLLNDLLLNEGFGTIECENGATGYELATKVIPSAIFLDLQLPDLSGEVVLDKLKADSRTKHIPVIIHTGKLLSDEELKALAEKSAAVVTKGIPVRDSAAERIRQALKKIGIQGAHAAEAKEEIHL